MTTNPEQEARAAVDDAVLQHRDCYGEWHVCAWYEPTEHDAPRKASQ